MKNPRIQQAAERAETLVRRSPVADHADALADTLTDLRHFAYMHDIDFQSALQQSSSVYLAEKEVRP